MATMDTNQKIYDVVMERLSAKRLRAARLTRRDVADGSGVPFSTVSKIATGQTENPSVHHIQALYDYFMSEIRQAA